MMKKCLLSVLIICITAFLISGCGQANIPSTEEAEIPKAETKEFTDSTGRTVTVPAEITKIAISGPLSQVYILPLAGDMLVGVSNAYAEDMAKYLPAYLYEKIEIGQLYGGKGEMDLEALLAAAPDIVIDIGETKDSAAEDLTELTERTGIPFVHIYATVAEAPEAYRTLGKLLGREEKAEELASWCETTYHNMTEMMAKVDADGVRKSLLYCLGDKGVNVLAEGSFHADTINLLGRNLAVIEEVVSSGAGNEVDMEQILLWDPDVIIFAPDSCYDDVETSKQWSAVRAIYNDSYYQTPYGPYGWLSSPPSVQRYLGMLWLGALLYPEYVEYDLQEEITRYYKLFYDCELNDAMYQELIHTAF